MFDRGGNLNSEHPTSSRQNERSGLAAQGRGHTYPPGAEKFFATSSATEHVRLSIVRSKIRNDGPSTLGRPTSWDSELCPNSFENFLGNSPGRAVPSIQSATSSSSIAERSSNSRKKERSGSGSSKPGNWRRYFRDAILIRKSVLNCGCHSRISSRSARSNCREGPNSKRTPSARDLTLSNWALIVSRSV